MAYTNFQNCTKQEYDSIIYSQEDKNKCKLYFNDVELQDADEYLEKITIKDRVLPENGKKIFGLDNFISKECEVVIHNVSLEDIQDKVRIELGTLVDEQNDTWEYIPMGVFNIQDTPTRNDDKVTIKLRDNAVLFDFKYNAKPLIDENGGSATKLQILQDICTKASVTCGVSSFLGDTDLIGIYDNTVTGRAYVSYLAEQAGCIAKIDRNGALIFVSLNNLTTQRIPLSICGKYTKGTPFEIQRLVFELGTIKFETSNDETLQTMYLSSLNPYISTELQVLSIFNTILDGFTIDSVEIVDNILGNPSIDGYDLIELYDDNDVDEPTIFTTLANNTIYYNGKFRTKYKTEIGLEERKENVTNTGEAVFRKTVTSEIDNLNGTVTTTVSNIETLNTQIEDTNSQLGELNSDLSGQINGVNSDLQAYKGAVETKFTQTSGSFEMQFTNLNQLIQQVGNTESQHYTTFNKYIRFVNGVIILGEEGNAYTVELSNTRLSFKQSGNEVAYISNNKLYITDLQALNQLQIGNFAFIPRTGGSLSFRKVG